MFYTEMDWAMDTEVYPNIIICQFIHMLSDERKMYGAIKANKQGVVYDKWFTQDEQGKLTATSSSYFMDFLNGKRLIGYNSAGFDNIILNSMIQGIRANKGVIDSTYEWGQRVIKYTSPYSMPKSVQKEAFSLRYPREDDNIPYLYIDLARVITGNGGRFPSLKAIGIAMKWPTLQDLPLDPKQPVPIDKLQLLIDYGWNDVEITKRLGLELETPPDPKDDGEITLRSNIADYFGTDLYATLNASRSKLTNIIFEQQYASRFGELKIEQEYIDRKQSTPINVEDIIAPNIAFRDSKLCGFLDKLRNGVIMPGERKALSYQVEHGGVVYQLGVGGLHSVDGPGIFKSTERHVIIDADVTSYYPYIILKLKLAPEHLNAEEFIIVLESIVDERVEAKAQGNMVKANGLKITINGATGKFNSVYWKLYDPVVYYSMTLNGQLYLLMLAEMIGEMGGTVLSANTDGVTARIPVDKMDDYYAVCKRWEELTQFNLEYATYLTYARRDVNNYIAVTDKGKIKEKGIFVNKPGYDQSHNALVVRRAVRQYIVDGTPLSKTVREGDVYDYMYSQTVGKQFDVYWRSTHSDDTGIQRKARYYVVKPCTGVNYGSVVKIHKEKGTETSLLAGKSVYLANDVTDNMPEPDYDYYEGKARKLLLDVIGQPRLL